MNQEILLFVEINAECQFLSRLARLLSERAVGVYRVYFNDATIIIHDCSSLCMYLQCSAMFCPRADGILFTLCYVRHEYNIESNK